MGGYKYDNMANLHKDFLLPILQTGGSHQSGIGHKSWMRGFLFSRLEGHTNPVLAISHGCDVSYTFFFSR